MAFVEAPRFPDSIALGATGGPLYSVEVIELNSGHEQRNTPWSEARARYAVALVAMNNSKRNQLLAYIRAVAKGRQNGFRFKDYLDFEASHADAEVGLGILSAVSGSQDVWQLKKRYTSGSNTFDRTIYKPVSTTVQIKSSGGAVLTSGVHYTLDATTGRITLVGSPTVAPGSWSGEFDVPVRLDADYAALRALFSGATEWAALELVETRVVI